MAEQRKNKEHRQLRQDAIVDGLAPDPARPAEVAVAAGFLGKSLREGYWRLYLNPELTAYLEFAEAEVVHTEPSNVGRLQGTIVWLNRKAIVRSVSLQTHEMQAEFLQGGIDARFRGIAMPGGMVAGALAGGIGPAITFRTSFCDIIVCSLVPGDPCYTQYNCISRVLWPCV